MRKVEFIKKNLVLVLSESNDWVDIRDLTYRIAEKNGSYCITPNAVARVSSLIINVERRKVHSNSTSVTQYRLLQ